MASDAGPPEQKVGVQRGSLSGDAKLAAQNQHLQYSQEKQVGSSHSTLEPVHGGGLGYSDLEVVETAGLEVAGSDASQVILPRYHDHDLGPQPVHTLQPKPPPVQQYDSGHATLDQPITYAKADRRIWGLQRRVFCIVLGVAIFGIVLALGVGIGVGVGLNSSSTTAAASTSATATPTSSTTATDTLPAAVATGTATANMGITCPAANRTLYELPDSSSSNMRLLVLCGRDYNSAAGAVDLTSLTTTTFEGCLEACGEADGCVAVGWGTYYDVPTCWLKSAIGEPNWSAGWYSAVRDDDG